MRVADDDAWGVMTVWIEARGEPYEGKVAVAEVILRRSRKGFMSDGTIPGTVLRPWQFSGWNTDDSNRIRAAKIDDGDPVVAECLKAWEEAKAGSNFSGGALHYFNPSVIEPMWAKAARVVAEIGRHRFVLLEG